MEHISRLSTQKTSVSSPLSLRGSTSFAKGGFQTSRSAFTLVELMIVIAIIGVLAASLFPMMSGYMTKARDTARMNDIRSLNTAIFSYFTDTGNYPNSGTTGVGNYSLNSTGVITSTGSEWNGSLKNQIGNFLGGKMPIDPVSGKSYIYGSVMMTGSQMGYQLYSIPENTSSTCNTIKQSVKESVDGIYTIAPAPSSTGAFSVYCDMTTDGGGWIRMENNISDAERISIVNWFPSRYFGGTACDECNGVWPKKILYTASGSVDWSTASFRGDTLAIDIFKYRYGIKSATMVPLNFLGTPKNTSCLRATFLGTNLVTGKIRSEGDNCVTGIEDTYFLIQ